jgi:hypothetical protein
MATCDRQDLGDSFLSRVNKVAALVRSSTLK